LQSEKKAELVAGAVPARHGGAPSMLIERALDPLRELHKRARRLGISYRASLIILTLNVGAIIFEGIGLSMLLPIFEFIQKSGNVQELTASGRHWAFLTAAFEKLSIPLTLPTLLAVSFIAIAIRQAFIYVRVLYNSKVLFQSIHQLRQRAFSLTLSANTALQQDTVLGESVNDISVELPKAMNALYGTVHFISRVLLILAYLGGLLLLQPWMTAISLGVLLATGTLLVHVIRSTRSTGSAIVGANRGFSTFLIERLRSLRLIRLSGTERAERDNLTWLSEKQRDNEVRVRQLQARMDALVEPVAILGAFFILYIGYSHLNLEVTTLGLFMVVMMRLVPVAKDALGAFQSITAQWESLAVIDNRMRLIIAQREPAGGTRTMQPLRKAIRYDGVSFSYSPEIPALRDLSCEIPARRMTALVGPSGSGKSTFIDLMPRLRDPDRGTITIDGVPLQDFAVANLRTNIAFVPQAPQIFNVTAAEHIRYGRPEATEAEVHEAARLAGAAGFIERLPQGYNTKLGENGDRLSGGQRQRLDIARALVRRAAILILDEPTSQLDAESERLFRDALLRIKDETDSTIIIVGHRFSTVAVADRILVFDNGRIADSGTHQELMQRGGWYAKGFAGQHSMPVALPA
jgi:ABC-type multidrug transport system fused ATPase/permease subunit